MFPGGGFVLIDAGHTGREFLTNERYRVDFVALTIERREKLEQIIEQFVVDNGVELSRDVLSFKDPQNLGPFISKGALQNTEKLKKEIARLDEEQANLIRLLQELRTLLLEG